MPAFNTIDRAADDDVGGTKLTQVRTTAYTSPPTAITNVVTGNASDTNALNASVAVAAETGCLQDVVMPMHLSPAITNNIRKVPPCSAPLTSAPPCQTTDMALHQQLSGGEIEENAFFVADLSHLHRQYAHWQTQLPRVHPFYAVKCNPSPAVLATLAAQGVNFDCASRSEIAAVLALGVSPDRIVYANPCKQVSHIRYALQHGVRLMTFDNADELHKVKGIAGGDQARMVLRVLTDDSKSVCQLGLKFGAPLDQTERLLQVAEQLGTTVVGVSFHVGSGCYDAHAFEDAVQRARYVFDMAPRYNHHFTLLDIGGGFPGSSHAPVPFEDIVNVLNCALEHHFPASSGITLIAEPGRYFAEAAFTLAVCVIARRVINDTPSSIGDTVWHENDNDNDDDMSNRPTYMYYVSDGVYGSFNCTMFDHAVVQPRLLRNNGKLYTDTDADADVDVNVDTDTSASKRTALYDCSIWGPTCDSIDRINAKSRLPELQIGDWLRYDRMGAYTICAASRFNGFKQSRVVYIDSEGLAAEALGL